MDKTVALKRRKTLRKQTVRAALIGIFAVGAAALIWFVVMRDDGGHISGMDGIDLAAVAPGGPLADVIVPATLSAEAETGKAYYQAVCSACHGANAAGQDGIAPPLVHIIYEPSHHGDAAFYSAARNGVTSHHWPFGNMPPIEEVLTDGEIGAIVAYIREMQRENGIN